MFEGIEIKTYSHGLKGVLERIWHKLTHKTMFLPEKAINCGSFSYRRFMAGQFILEERAWYKWIRGLHRKVINDGEH